MANYIYAVKGNEIYVNLFTNNETEFNLSKAKVKLKQETNYPWDGNIKFSVTTTVKNHGFVLKIRYPGWAHNEAIPSNLYSLLENPNEEKRIVILTVNGKVTPLKLDKGYIVINRKWNTNSI